MRSETDSTQGEVAQAATGRGSFAENGFPFKALSLVSQASRRFKDPTYAAHRWWARRPPSVMRALVLGLALDAETTEEEFWLAYGQATTTLRGIRVHDPFAGGGSILVEASRLGATPSGTDVDPLAVEIVRNALTPLSSTEVIAANSQLLTHLERELDRFYPPTDGGWIPLHYFYLSIVKCPQCGHKGPLFDSLILAQASDMGGSVARDHAVVAFCPDCYELQSLDQPDRLQLRCGNRRFPLYRGTYEDGKYTCPHCGVRSSHQELQTGVAERKLIAIEDVTPGNKKPRRFRKPTAADLAGVVAAADFAREQTFRSRLPESKFATNRRDRRPVSYGIERATQAFTPRQLALFGLAFTWIDDCEFTRATKSALRVAISHALTTNNIFCSYAKGYGRIAPLFHIRGYAFPALLVELNPLNRYAGRGTIPAILKTVQSRAEQKPMKRHTWNQVATRVEPILTSFPQPIENAALVFRQSAAHPLPLEIDMFDLIVTDPPYFDLIAYEELSEFYRHWWPTFPDYWETVHPDKHEPIKTFSDSLGACFAMALKRLKRGRPLGFTYHSSAGDAWTALGLALDIAGLRITSIWPVLSDPHMGHHSKSGNCEWDVVILCRRMEETRHVPRSFTPEAWVRALAPLRVGSADFSSFEYASAFAGDRMGSLVSGMEKERKIL